MRKYALLSLVLLTLLGVGWFATRSRATLQVHRGNTMGSTFAVSWVENVPHPSLPQEVDTILARITALMSTYDPTSQLSAFNRTPSTEWIEVAPELAEVVRIAQDVSDMSEGVFDVTVKPLVAAWGFGPDASKTPPTEEMLDAAAQNVGFRRLNTRANPPALRKEIPGLQVDLNGIAPGYAVDLIANALEQQGITDYLVDVGGELRVAGHTAESTNWRVALKAPDAAAESVDSVFQLENTALATSGDYRNYYEVNGKRLSHTIDPRTRRPIAHRLASVTVLAPTAAVADARASALNVWGPDEGLRRAVAQDWSVLMLVRVDGERFEQRRTGWFAALGEAP